MSETAGTLLRIDLGALAANYRILRDAGKGVATASVIKANGYGLGLAEVGQALSSEGCGEFFVANIDEGIALRAALGPKPVIYVIGPVLPGNAGTLRAHGLIPVLNSLMDVDTWRREGAGASCVIHFDTGMNRLGLETAETARVLADPRLLDGIKAIMGMSHFASSEDNDDQLNEAQIKRFRVITSRLTLPRWSFCNTSAIFRFPEDCYQLTRAGYGLYGGNPLPHAANPMRPVVTLESRVLHTKRVRKGESAGYNATYVFPQDTEIAVLGLGYADGFLRSQSSKGLTYFQGQACPIVGRVSMDLTTVEIGHLQGPKPRQGDMVEILGPNQDVDALAGRAGTNGYEMLTRLGSRYARHYIKSA